MPATEIRKIVTFVEETRTEMGIEIDPPARQCAAVAVIKNPYAGRYSETLPELEAAGAELGNMLGRRAMDAAHGRRCRRRDDGPESARRAAHAL